MKRLHTSMKCIVGILLVVLMVVPNGLKAETTEVFQASKVTGVVLDELGEPVVLPCVSRMTRGTVLSRMPMDAM